MMYVVRPESFPETQVTTFVIKEYKKYRLCKQETIIEVIKYVQVYKKIKLKNIYLS